MNSIRSEAAEGRDISTTETNVSLGSNWTLKDEDYLFFNNGVDRIDYILAYKVNTGDTNFKKVKKRKQFESELEKEGLKLEREDRLISKNVKICFVKIHAPWDVLTKYAELLNMRMPLVQNDMKQQFTSCWSMFHTPFDLDKNMKPVNVHFTAPFSCVRMHRLVTQEEQDSFFTNAQRNRIVYEILSRAPYCKMKFGIKKMISNESYNAAYPLHDGKYFNEHSSMKQGKMNDRQGEHHEELIAGVDMYMRMEYLRFGLFSTVPFQQGKLDLNCIVGKFMYWSIQH